MRTLEELFERDISRFLDERTGSKVDRKKMVRAEEETVFDIPKDYEKEVDKAIAKDDLQKAKKLFDELKESYSKLKYSDADKARLFRIMDTVHMKIKEYLIKKQQEKNIFQEVSEFDSTSPAPTNPVQQLLTDIQDLITKNDVLGAKEKAKLLVGAYNGLVPQQRTQAMYDQIKAVLLRLQ